MNKIKYVLVFLVLIIVGVGAFLFFKNKNLDNEIINKLLNPEKPILIKENNLYGYIDSKGKVIISPRFKQASDFNGEYAIVAYDENESEKYAIIDKKGNAKLSGDYDYYSFLYDFEYVSEYDIWVIEGILYDGDLKRISAEGEIVDYKENGYLEFVNEENKKAGIMNYKGKKTYSIDVNETYDFSFDVGYNENTNQLYCLVNNNEHYGIVNCENGKVIYNYQTKRIKQEGKNVFEICPSSEYCSAAEKYIYVEDNKIVFETSNLGEYGSISYEDGYIRIYDTNKDYSERYSYYNLKTKEYSSEKQEEVIDYGNKLREISCRDNYKSGLIRGDKVVVPCLYDDIDTLNETLSNYLENNNKLIYIVEKEDKSVIYDSKNNKELFTINSTYITDQATSTFIKATDDDTDEIIIYNLLSNQSMTFDKNTNVDIKSNYITVTDNKEIKYYNTELKHIYTVTK